MTFGKIQDTIEMPAIVKSLVIGDDYFLLGGTSNFQKFSWPVGYQPSWFLVAKTDTALNLKWVKYYGGDAYYVMMGIDETSDGSILAYGYRYNYSDPDADMDVYIIKLNQYGDVVFTKNIPINSKRVKVYPNPWNEALYIFTPEYCEKCTFTLSDLFGRAIIKNLILEPGSTKQVVLNSITPGSYFYSIFSGSDLYQSEIILKK